MSKSILLRFFAMAAVVLAAMGSVGAAEFSLGAGLAISTSPYKSHDKHLGVAPFAFYDSDRLYLRASEAGVYLWKNESHKLSAALRYSWLNFDPDECGNGEMKTLNKRRSTLMAGLSYAYTNSWGMIRMSLTRDILGKSDGFAGDASYHIPLTRGKLALLPGVGVSWQSEKHADYYFGVSRGESARSGIRQHEADAAFLPFASVEAKYGITDRLSAVAALRAELLTGSIRNSPIVGRSATFSGAVGMQFSF